MNRLAAILPPSNVLVNVEASSKKRVFEQAGLLFDGIRHRVLEEQRRALIAARDDGRLDDEVLRAELEARDIEEAAAAQRVLRRRGG